MKRALAYPLPGISWDIDDPAACREMAHRMAAALSETGYPPASILDDDPGPFLLLWRPGHPVPARWIERACDVTGHGTLNFGDADVQVCAVRIGLAGGGDSDALVQQWRRDNGCTIFPDTVPVSEQTLRANRG